MSRRHAVGAAVGRVLLVGVALGLCLPPASLKCSAIHLAEVSIKA